VANEVKEAVRRLRWKEAEAVLPGLLPTVADSGLQQPHNLRTVLVPCVSGISTMLKGKPCPKAAGPVRDLWHSRHRGDLASAVCGGQWTQARKALVPAFGVTDSSCQLCLEASGTSEHRFCCPKTCPDGGWPNPPPEASLVQSKLSEQRQRHLKLHGLLAVKVEVARHAADGTFQWLVPPPEDDPTLQGATWYCDGSLLDGRWKAIRCTGFGIAVASRHGDLLAYGMGWPPSWCDTAAAAEAWALQFVVCSCPFVPAIRTDCQALVTTAVAGTSDATHHARPLARIWTRIAHAVDDDLAAIVTSGKLVWMPAHKSHTAIGEALKGDGSKVTVIDWRANRLVDALAKAAATYLQAPSSVAALLRSADAAAAHAACLLGVVTHSANNYKTTQLTEGGTSVSVTFRDSSDRPKGGSCGTASGSRAVPSRQLPAPLRPNTSSTVLPWTPPTPKVMANRIHRASSRDALVRRVNDIGARLAPVDGRPTGAERLSALAARVRAKSSPPSLCVGACVHCPEVTSNDLWEGPTQAASDGLGLHGGA
jgi:hypothetical protein